MSTHFREDIAPWIGALLLVAGFVMVCREQDKLSAVCRLELARATTTADSLHFIMDGCAERLRK